MFKPRYTLIVGLVVVGGGRLFRGLQGWGVGSGSGGHSQRRCPGHFADKGTIAFILCAQQRRPGVLTRCV